METLLRAASPESVSIVLRASPTAALRSMAETAAAEGLPLELERLGSGGQRELAVRYETSPDELVGVLTERHIDGLLNPLGTATSKLQLTTPASEGRIIADLYWRCCIAMQMMPLASLKALAKHHPDLQQHLPADDAEEAVQRRGLVVALLPRFSMACVTEEEAAAAAKRREELEAIRKQREQLAAEEAQAGQQPSAAPGAGQPADDKREARRDQADRDASGVLV